MIRQKLFSEPVTGTQFAIVLFWFLNLGAVGILWATTSDFGSFSDWLDAFGMLFGLLAVFFALTQVLLMSRARWIERSIGFDQLVATHKRNGILVFVFIILHPIFITVSYALASGIGILPQFGALIFHYKYVWLATIGFLLFIAVGIGTLYKLRTKMRFEAWYYLHLTLYIAIIFAAIHPFFVSDSFAGGHPLATGYWIALYAFVALNVIVYRLGVPLVSSTHRKWRIEKVVPESKTVTSIYIKGKIAHWNSRAGQFAFFRFLQKGFTWQEHPFTLSQTAANGELRISARNVGDFTANIQKLHAGTRVVVSGPYGHFTSGVAKTNKRLFIAGGIGITPFISLIDESLTQKIDTVLLYANRTSADIPLRNEIADDIEKGLRAHFVFSQEHVHGADFGHIDFALVKKLVPDFLLRDVYICGPVQLIENLTETLLARGVKESQLHYELFSLSS